MNMTDKARIRIEAVLEFDFEPERYAGMSEDEVLALFQGKQGFEVLRNRESDEEGAVDTRASWAVSPLDVRVDQAMAALFERMRATECDLCTPDRWSGECSVHRLLAMAERAAERERAMIVAATDNARKFLHALVERPDSDDGVDGARVVPIHRSDVLGLAESEAIRRKAFPALTAREDRAQRRRQRGRRFVAWLLRKKSRSE